MNIYLVFFGLFLTAAAYAQDEAVLVLVPQQTLASQGRIQFEVMVRNETGASVTVPYLYDCRIQVDDQDYVQTIPKPKLSAEARQVFETGTSEVFGYLALNDPQFPLADAATGRIPLRLSAGQHGVVLTCGDYASEKTLFKVDE